MPSKTDQRRLLGEVHVRFLNLAAAVRTLPALGPLDPLEERLLNWLALQNWVGRELSVRQVMQHREFGAPATIHTRLTAMRRSGWIVLANTEDSRRKRVELTRDARRYLARLGQCIIKAVGDEVPERARARSIAVGLAQIATCSRTNRAT